MVSSFKCNLEKHARVSFFKDQYKTSPTEPKAKDEWN